jgi:homoserine kinase
VAAERRITVQVPASTSNLGSGFDALGMALQIHSRYDVTVLNDGPPFHIEATGLNAERIRTDEDNLALQAFRMLCDFVDQEPPPIRMRVLNGIPLERGLGGSASAILGGMLAANAAIATPLDDDAVLALATELDGHADNVTASLYGGLRVVCRDGRKVISLPIAPSDDLQIVLAVPRISVATRAARTILPAEVPLEDAAYNIGRAALLVAAFASLEYSCLDVAMEDRLHQQHRKLLIPQMDAVFLAAREAGALAAALSGSGPSILAFCTTGAEDVGEAMRRAFAAGRVEATVHITTIDFRGASVTVVDVPEAAL